jgi:hypothetical protein
VTTRAREACFFIILCSITHHLHWHHALFGSLLLLLLLLLLLFPIYRFGLVDHAVDPVEHCGQVHEEEGGSVVDKW